ncbi:MAG: flippase [Clostridia bacterium]|nr:flippase [Clostridia bacterium]
MESVKKNFIYNTIYQILLVILPLITAPYISRTLGANAVGVYSYTNSVAYYFILIAMLGISNYGNRTIASVRDDKEKLNEKFSSIYSLQFILFIIAIISYVVYSLFIASENNMIFLLQTFYVASGLLDISWLFFGLEQFKLTVFRNVVIKILTVISMFIFVKDISDLWIYTLIMSLGTFISQLYLWFYVKKFVTFKKVSFRNITENIKPIIILFIPVIAYSIYKVMDKIMLGNISNYSEVGYYNNAEKIINIPMGIITALGTVMLPRMSNMVANGKNDKSKQYISLSVKLVTIISSAIAFGLMGISNVFTPVFFGEGFEPSAKIIYLLSITVFFISWANVIRTQYLMPNNYDKIYVISTVVGGIVNLIINLLLIPKYAAVGAAIGTIFAEFSVMIMQVFAVRKEIPVLKYIFEYMPVLIIGFCMMFIVNWLGTLIGDSIVTIVVQILVGGLFFLICTLAFLAIKKDEFWRMSKNMFQKMLKIKVN